MRLGAGCWSKCGSRLTPCGQVTLFRNSSRMPLSMPFFFPLWLFRHPPQTRCLHNPPQGPSLCQGYQSKPWAAQGAVFPNPWKASAWEEQGPKSIPSFVPFLLFPVSVLGFTRAAQPQPHPRQPCRCPSSPWLHRAARQLEPGALLLLINPTGCSQNLASTNPGCLTGRKTAWASLQPPPHLPCPPQHPKPTPGGEGAIPSRTWKLQKKRVL